MNGLWSSWGAAATALIASDRVVLARTVTLRLAESACAARNRTDLAGRESIISDGEDMSAERNLGRECLWWGFYPRWW